jgi:hypothetical protein
MTLDFKVDRKCTLKDSTSTSHSRNTESQNWERVEHDRERAACLGPGEELKVALHVVCHDFHKPAGNNGRNVFTIIATLEEIGHHIDLRDIDDNSALRKDKLTLGLAQLAADFDREVAQIRKWAKARRKTRQKRWRIKRLVLKLPPEIESDLVHILVYCFRNLDFLRLLGAFIRAAKVAVVVFIGSVSEGDFEAVERSFPFHLRDRELKRYAVVAVADAMDTKWFSGSLMEG